MRHTLKTHIVRYGGIVLSHGRLFEVFLECLTLLVFITATGNAQGTDPQVDITSPGGGTILSGSVRINADATATAGVDRVEFYDGATLLGTDMSDPYSYLWDTTNVDAGIHLLTAVVYDVNGGTDTSPEISTLKADYTPPTTPSNLRTSSSTISTLTLDWDASIDNVGVIGYKIFRNNSFLTTTTDLTFTDTNLTPSTDYSYGVSSYDGSFNQSGTAHANFSTPADVTPPSVPNGLGASSVTDKSLRITWAASTDDGFVAGYDVYRNNTLITTTDNLYYDDTGLGPLTNYSYKIVAFDGANNISAASSPYSVDTTVDITAPSVPTGLGATNITDKSLRISWTPSTDNGHVAGYRVYRDDVALGTVSHPYYDDSNLTPSTGYAYKVEAYDDTGNTSATSTTYTTATTVDVTAPSVPNGLGASNVADNAQRISWSPSTDNGTLAGYNVYRNNSLIGNTTLTYFDDTGLTPVTGYTYKVEAYDSLNNTSAKSTGYLSTTIADAIVPASPTNLQIVSATSTSQQITWTASTDDVAVTGYRVYIDGTLLGSTALLTYTSSTLTPLTNYTYTVEAFDAALNYSALSSSVSGSTPADTTLPQVAFGGGITTGMNVVGTIQVPGTATDNFQVASIKLYIDSTLVATGVNSVNYTWDSTTLPLGAHTLRLDALDSSDNPATVSVPVTIRPVPKRGDVNNDFKVNVFDLSIMLSHWNRNFPAADLDHNGIVNIFDLSILLGQYGR